MTDVKMKTFKVLTALLVLITSISIGAEPEKDSEKSRIKPEESVILKTQRLGRQVTIIIENKNTFDVTASVTLKGNNLDISRIKEKTDTYKAGTEESYATLMPADPARPLNFTYEFKWIKGDVHAKHDDETIYQLPYPSGESYRVLQGYNGSLSHKGSQQYAIDFVMPEGTTICAARSGVVVDLVESSKIGGLVEENQQLSNYITILHSDGTFAEYHHLKYNCVLVKIGQQVIAGDKIALSGNTGYSNIPHLHFIVYSPQDSTKWKSYPVTFITREGIVSEPVVRKMYTAQ